MSSRIRTLAVALLAIAALAAVPVAQAATEAGLAVDASVTPTRATYGDSVTAAYTVTNTGPKAQNVAITTTLSAPDGTTKSVTERVRLASGETHTRSVSYTIDASYPRGTYYATVEAAGKDGTESDTATLEIY